MKKMFKNLVKEKGLLAGLLVVVFQFSVIILVSVLTLQSIKIVLLTLIIAICVVNLRKMLFIKVK